MKLVFAIIIIICSYPVFARKSLDSTDTHPYIKLTSYPFFYPISKSNYAGSFAIGPTVSISGEHFEMQIGILFDLQKHQAWIHSTHASPPTLLEFHNYYLPFILNYYFILSKKIKIYPTIGGGYIIPNLNDSQGWVFAGGGISYKVSEKIKLNLSIHERLARGEFSQGAFFEIAYRLN